jgi:hypothetical protein
MTVEKLDCGKYLQDNDFIVGSLKWKITSTMHTRDCEVHSCNGTSQGPLDNLACSDNSL